MKKLFILMVAVLAFTSCKPKYANDYELKDQLDSVSYSLGYFEGKAVVEMMHRLPFDTINYKMLAGVFSLGNFSEKYANLRRDQFDTIKYDAFMYGFTHMIYFQKAKFEDQQADFILNQKFSAVKAEKQAKLEELAKENEEKGAAFLEENAKNDSVKVLESGVQYKVLTEGTGKVPEANQYVRVLYEGRTIDGEVFDSTTDKEKGFRCKTTGNIIEGWKEVLQMMPVGSKWEVYIPSDKAYKHQQMGNIEPGSTLIFTIELLSIEESKTAAKPKKK